MTDGLKQAQLANIKAVEEEINRISQFIADDAVETSRRRMRLQADTDFDLAAIKIQHEEAMHIVRTYDMRRARHEMLRVLENARGVGFVPSIVADGKN